MSLKSWLKDYLLPDNKGYKMSNTVLIAWTSILGLCALGSFTKVPGCHFALIFSSAVLTAYNVSALYRLHFKDRVNNIYCICALCWFIFLLWGLFYNDGYQYKLFSIKVIYALTFLFSFMYYEWRKDGWDDAWNM